MDIQSVFANTIVKCICDAIRSEVHRKPNGTEEHLRSLFRNTTAFQELDTHSWGRDEQALVDWTLEAFVWVASIRKVCRELMQLSKQVLELDTDSFDLNLKSLETSRPVASFNEIVSNVAVLRDQAQKIQEAFESMKARSMLASERPRGIGATSVVISGCPGSDQRTRAVLEEGELGQDATAIRSAHWEHLKEVKEHMINLETSRNMWFNQVRDLEHRIMSCKPSSSPLAFMPKEVQRVIHTSTRGMRWEVERLSVEIEDSLLRFKVNEYTRIRGKVEPALEIISSIH